MKVPFGVLALQGDFAAHAQALRDVGAEPREVRRVAELEGLRGLVLPGGESTTLLRLMADAPEEGPEGSAAWHKGPGEWRHPRAWFHALADFHERGGVLFGTCAGAILVAREVRPHQPSLGLLDATVRRNAYGRQVDSFATEVDAPALGGRLPAVFIRAPRFSTLGQVEVLATHGDEPVLLRQGRLLAATFHPELGSSRAVHDLAVDLARRGAPLESVTAEPARTREAVA